MLEESDYIDQVHAMSFGGGDESVMPHAPLLRETVTTHLDFRITRLKTVSRVFRFFRFLRFLRFVARSTVSIFEIVVE